MAQTSQIPPESLLKYVSRTPNTSSAIAELAGCSRAWADSCLKILVGVNKIGEIVEKGSGRYGFIRYYVTLKNPTKKSPWEELIEESFIELIAETAAKRIELNIISQADEIISD